MNSLNYDVTINKTNYDAAAAWCENILGPSWSSNTNPQGKWACFNKDFKYYSNGTYTFYFKDLQDATFFALKYS